MLEYNIRKRMEPINILYPYIRPLKIIKVISYGMPKEV